MPARNKTGRAITLIVLTLAVVGIIFTLINFTKADTKSPEIGQEAPAFTLVDISGQTVSLKDYRGKVVLLNFWGTWCEPCRLEMPAIEEVYKQYSANDFVVLAVNIGESAVTAKGFTDRLGITFPVVLDSDRKVTLDIYKIGPLPSSLFIDKQGVIQTKFEGAMTKDYIENRVKTLLAQP